MVCFNRPCRLNFFEGCIPQILRGPFLNTLSHAGPCQTFMIELSAVIVQDYQKLFFSQKALL